MSFSKILTLYGDEQVIFFSPAHQLESRGSKRGSVAFSLLIIQEGEAIRSRKAKTRNRKIKIRMSVKEDITFQEKNIIIILILLNSI